MSKDNKIKKIIVIDDDEDIGVFLNFELSKLNYELTICKDSISANAILEKVKFDCMILDINLGGTSSASVLAKNKSEASALNFSTPIIILSGFVSDVIYEKLKNRVNLIIHKPLKKGDMTRYLASIFRPTYIHRFDYIKKLEEIMVIIASTDTSEVKAEIEKNFYQVLKSYELLFINASDDDKFSEFKNDEFLGKLLNSSNELIFGNKDLNKFLKRSIELDENQGNDQGLVKKDSNIKSAQTAKKLKEMANVTVNNSTNLIEISEDQLVTNEEQLKNSLQELMLNTKDVDNRNVLEQTALMLACRLGFIEVVKDLISRGASLKAKSQDGKTVLHYAVLGGESKIVKLLLEKGEKSITRDNIGFDALTYAIYMKNEAIVKTIVNEGANLTFKTKNGQTYLISAVAADSIEIFKFLLENGADISQRDGGGRNVFWNIKKQNKTHFNPICNEYQAKFDAKSKANS